MRSATIFNLVWVHAHLASEGQGAVGVPHEDAHVDALVIGRVGPWHLRGADARVYDGHIAHARLQHTAPNTKKVIKGVNMNPFYLIKLKKVTTTKVTSVSEINKAYSHLNVRMMLIHKKNCK